MFASSNGDGLWNAGANGREISIVTGTTHRSVVTLVHGNSLDLWELDDDAPWHLSSALASNSSRPEIGAVVGIMLENGRPASIGRSSEASSPDVRCRPFGR
jgi:hypothetical protein